MSATNGKVQFDAGVLTLPMPAFTGRAAGTLTVPLGDRYGMQADLGIVPAPGFSASAALHVFTRDPQSYLIGGTLGIVATPGATVFAAGPEAELYFDRWTLEAWGGLAIARSRAPTPAVRAAPFITADFGFYPTDNWRVSAGVSLLDGYGAARIGTEMLFDSPLAPLAFTADARIGQDGAVRATIGLRAYFAPETKSLLARHREDDPADRGLTLYSAVGERGSTGSRAPTRPGDNHPGGNGPPVPGNDDPAQPSCDYDWFWDGTSCVKI